MMISSLNSLEDPSKELPQTSVTPETFQKDLNSLKSFDSFRHHQHFYGFLKDDKMSGVPVSQPRTILHNKS